MYELLYCAVVVVVGSVLSHQRFCVGELVGITQNKIKNQIIMIAKPERTNQFLVPHKFLSNQAMFPNISARYQEK